MTISVLLAWAAVLLTAVLMFKFVSRKLALGGSRNGKRLNRTLRKSHCTLGLVMLGVGLLHGIFAGNAPWSTLTDMTAAPVLFTWNAGTICLLIAALLALSYALRKRLKKAWIPVHRVLSVAMAAALIVHLCTMGITIDDLLFKGIGSTKVSVSQTTAATNATEETAVTNATEEAAEADTAAAVENTSSETLQEQVNEAVAVFSGAVLADGVYSGTGSGYHGDITVQVTVSGGQVADIAVTSENDTLQYFTRAKDTLIPTVIEEQSLGVDAVSGATYSSRGILEAITDALSGAVVSGTLAGPASAA